MNNQPRIFANDCPMKKQILMSDHGDHPLFQSDITGHGLSGSAAQFLLCCRKLEIKTWIHWRE